VRRRKSALVLNLTPVVRHDCRNDVPTPSQTHLKSARRFTGSAPELVNSGRSGDIDARLGAGS
jgi:hypothetical protein